MPHTVDLSMLMGRLLERTETVLLRLERIDRRLENGDRRMDEMHVRLGRIETSRPDGVPGWERWVKAMIPWAIGTATLAATGSLEQAAKAVATLAGAK